MTFTTISPLKNYYIWVIEQYQVVQMSKSCSCFGNRLALTLPSRKQRQLIFHRIFIIETELSTFYIYIYIYRRGLFMTLRIIYLIIEINKYFYFLQI